MRISNSFSGYFWLFPLCLISRIAIVGHPLYGPQTTLNLDLYSTCAKGFERCFPVIPAGVGAPFIAPFGVLTSNQTNVLTKQELDEEGPYLSDSEAAGISLL